MDSATLASRALRRVRGIPPGLAARCVALPSVSKRAAESYLSAKDRHRPHLPILTSQDRLIVDQVSQTGVFVTSLAALALPGTKEMFEAGQALAEQYRAMSLKGEMRHKDAFQGTSKDILDNLEIFNWGLGDRLLDIVENYIGLPIGYDGLNIFYTKADGRQVAARKWHRDMEDRAMLKVAVYLNDVDEEGGPLQILRATIPGTEPDDLAGYPVLTDDALQKSLRRRLTDDEVATCVGPAGTVIFADTARMYHRGKPAVSRDRCAIFYNYFSRSPLRPFYCERSSLSRGQLQTVANTLPPRGSSAVLWRDSLPTLSRLIPPAPV